MTTNTFDNKSDNNDDDDVDSDSYESNTSSAEGRVMASGDFDVDDAGEESTVEGRDGGGGWRLWRC